MRTLLLAGGLAAVMAVGIVGAGRAAPTEQTFQAKTTGDLAQLCATPASDPAAVAAVHFCHGYLIGAFQVLREVNEARGKHAAFCLPQAVPTRNEAVADFVKWAQADAADSALPPADGVYVFLKTRFPCAKKP
jgi:hypothetical protein